MINYICLCHGFRLVWGGKRSSGRRLDGKGRGHSGGLWCPCSRRLAAWAAGAGAVCGTGGRENLVSQSGQLCFCAIINASKNLSFQCNLVSQSEHTRDGMCRCTFMQAYGLEA